MPTLVLDDGRALGESNAILWYFGDGTRFVPADRYERAQVLQWQFFEQYEHEPSLAVVRFWLAYSGEPEAFADRVESGGRPGTARSTRWSGTSPAASGSSAPRMTLADISLYAYTHVAHEGGFELEPYPAIEPGSTGSPPSRGT